MRSPAETRIKTSPVDHPDTVAANASAPPRPCLRRYPFAFVAVASPPCLLSSLKLFFDCGHLGPILTGRCESHPINAFEGCPRRLRISEYDQKKGCGLAWAVISFLLLAALLDPIQVRWFGVCRKNGNQVIVLQGPVRRLRKKTALDKTRQTDKRREGNRHAVSIRRRMRIDQCC